MSPCANCSLATSSGENRSLENPTFPGQTIEKSPHINNGTKMDFSSSSRAEVEKEYKDSTLGLEVRIPGEGH